MTKRPNRTAIFMLTGIVVVIASVVATPSRASASVSADSPPDEQVEVAPDASGATAEGDVAAAGIGQGVRVWTGNVPIYQCPWTFCNYGLAQTNHDVALICSWDNSTPSGRPWYLVLDRGAKNDYNAVGWVDSYWVDPYTVSYPPSHCYDIPHNYRVIGKTWHAYQCPATFCNRSSDWISGDYVWTYCVMNGWQLSFNVSRRLYQVGFIYNPSWSSPTSC